MIGRYGNAGPFGLCLGQPKKRSELKRAKKTPDWTAGCIAVKNEEIEEIYAMVNKGTLITLRP